MSYPHPHGYGGGPDFVGIGAQKAGTTWLHDNLEVQPELWLPPEKEIHFFNRVAPHERLLGVEVRGLPPLRERYRPALARPSMGTVRWLRRFHHDPPSNVWYYGLFPPSLVQDRIAGEITPAYSTLDERGVAFARRVLKPECRVFLIVRNPIERAWSAVKMDFRWHEEDIREADVNSVVERLGYAGNRLRGDYERMVRLWGAAFGSAFRVFLYDDLVADAAAFLESVARFVGVSGELDHSRLGARSNVDPAARRMPERVGDILQHAYTEEIRALDTLVPGVEQRWLR